MKVGQARTQLKALNLDSDSQACKKTRPATKLDGIDSPLAYRHQLRKPRGARKHDVPEPKRSGGLREMLLAQAHAGKHDSAEIYRPVFGPDAKGGNEGGSGWLQGADFDSQTLINMSSVDFDRVDFSRSEPADDLSDVSDWADAQVASDGPSDMRASAKGAHRENARGDFFHGPSDDDGDLYDFEYMPQISQGASLGLSSKGAAHLVRMSDADLAKVDVTDYF